MAIETPDLTVAPPPSDSPPEAPSSRAGPVAYGLAFTVLLPLALVAWAAATTGVVPLESPMDSGPGWLLALAGVGLMVWSMASLWHDGRGLPMNAFPPHFYVESGPYAWVRHPIYVGFGMTCFGVAIATGSASGFWLVAPIACLAAAALVLGYENHDLKRRFPDRFPSSPRIHLPAHAATPPTGWERASVYLLVFVPWAVAYEAVQIIGIPPDGFEILALGEREWPVVEWTEWIYVSVYPLVLLAPLMLNRRDELRRFALLGLFATITMTLLYLVIPVISPPRPFTPRGTAGALMLWERASANTVGAFPAFHVIWALMAADALSRRFPTTRMLWWIWALAVWVSCSTTGIHAMADLIAAVAMFLVIEAGPVIYRGLLWATEAVANSWREWRVGPVRFMNHGIYAGLAGAVGFWIVGLLTGPELLPWVFFVALSSLVGAGLWAQKLEGSPALSRPFGYYGSLIGGLSAAVLAGIMGQDGILLAAAFVTAAPIIQSIGRLRCLVQGCCHGSPTSDDRGIRYRIPRSRVLTIGGLGGVPLHPTPLYSILANLVWALLLGRLWVLGASLPLIMGLGFIFAGLSRFVEESYRGEPQTPMVAGLRIYQWAAVVSVILGAVLTTLAPVAAPPLAVEALGPGWVAGGIAFGLLAGLAMGMDFPGSNRKFARLASV